MNIDILQAKLCDKLIGSGWDKALRFFVQGSDFYDILLWLAEEKRENRRWTPSLNDIFVPFQSCRFDEVKVIFLCPEPWTDPTINNGMAISINTHPKSQIPFKAFYEELSSTIPDHKLGDTSNLMSWAKQGVLLMNTSITTRVGSPGRHNKIWNPFTNYVLDVLNRRQDIVWVFFGENEYWESVDNVTHTKFKVDLLPEDRRLEWKTNIFRKCNEELKIKNKKLINW